MLAGVGPICWPVLKTQVLPIRSAQEPPSTKGDWWTWPDMTKSGSYCRIHAVSASSP